MNARMLVDLLCRACVVVLACGLALSTIAFGQPPLRVTKVVLTNSDSTGTATLYHRVRAGNARNYQIVIDPEHTDEIASSLRATGGVVATLPAGTPGEGAQIQDAFRLDFDALKDDELSRRLDKLVGKAVHVVRTSGNPREIDGTLGSFTATTVTLDNQPAPIDRTKIDSMELAEQSLRTVPPRHIAVTVPAGSSGEVSYTFTVKPWTISYHVDVAAQTFTAITSMVNSSAVAWSNVPIDLQNGLAYFHAERITLAPHEAGEVDAQPFDPDTFNVIDWDFPFFDWFIAVRRFPDLVFDASEQSSNDSPYVMLELRSPGDVGPWLLDGQVTVSFNDRLITAKLPSADSKIVRPPAAPGTEDSEFRYIKLVQEPRVTVKYDGPREVFGKIVSLGDDCDDPTAACEQTDVLNDNQLTVRLGRLTTYTAKFSRNATYAVQVLARTEPGWTLSPASKVITLSNAHSTAEALAVSDDIELTFDTRIADSKMMRAMARRYPGNPLARKLLDMLPDDTDRLPPVPTAWPYSPPGAAD